MAKRINFYVFFFIFILFIFEIFQPEGTSISFNEYLAPLHNFCYMWITGCTRDNLLTLFFLIIIIKKDNNLPCSFYMYCLHVENNMQMEPKKLLSLRKQQGKGRREW